MVIEGYLILTVSVQTRVLSVSVPFILQSVYISVTISIILSSVVNLMSLGVLTYVVFNNILSVLILIHNI